MLSRIPVIVEEGTKLLSTVGNCHNSINRITVNHHKQLENTEKRKLSLDRDLVYDLSNGEDINELSSSIDKVDKNGLYITDSSLLLGTVEQGTNSKAHKSVTFSDQQPLNLSPSLTKTQPLPNSISPLSSNLSPTSLPLTLCVASTGESSYELSSINSGVSLFAPVPQNNDCITSKETQTENKNGRTEITVRAAQTFLEEEPPSTITSVNYQKLQSKVEALLLSNELLKTSLDDSRRQVSSLQSTVVGQREEIAVKESQINTINGRVSALLRGMESTDSDNMQYKELYHKSVQQNAMLQGQLNQFTRIGSNMQTFLARYEAMSKQLISNKELIDLWKKGLEQREQQCLEKVKEVCLLKSAHQQVTEDCHKLTKSNRTLSLAREMVVFELVKETVRAVITSAKLKLLSEQAFLMKESLTRENYDLQGKIAHLLDSFKHAEDEFQENSEFSAIEREMLLETNQELEHEMKTLKAELKEGEEQFQKLIAYIKQYQQESTEKTTILKTNLTKANEEVEELDKLVEQVRQVLSDNISCISNSKPLLAFLQKLNGEETS